MIGVGCKGTTKNKVKVLARFSDDELDSATELAESLAEHQGQEFLVVLLENNKYRVLKRVSKRLLIKVPTLRHPFRYPTRKVVTR